MLFKLYRRLVRFARPFRWKMLVAAILNIISNFVGAVNLLALLPIVSVVLGESKSVPGAGMNMPGGRNLLERFSDLFLVAGSNGALDTEASLVRICLFIFITYLAKNVLQYASGYTMTLVESGMVRDLRDSVFERLAMLSLDYYYDRKSGQLLSRLTNDVNQVNSVLTSSILTLVGQPVQMLMILTAMVVANVKMTAVAMLIAAASVLLVKFFGTTFKRMAHRLQQLQGDILSVAQEMIAGVKVVKSFGMEGYEVARFKAETEKHFHGSRRLARVRLITSPLNEMLAVLGFIGILWFGGHAVFAHEMRGSELFFFLAALISLMQPIKTLSDLNGRLYEASASAENLFAILDAEPSVKPGSLAAPADLIEPIVFSDVHFKYASATENAIDGLSLEVFPNEVLALVGPSGGGKTTLVDLLVRFYDPTAGSVSLGGHDLKEYDLESFRKLFGIVTQDTVLFHDTIFSNIAYGNKSATPEMVYEAARAANAHDFIQQMPEEYQTMVGDRGVRLSGGQRQRIAIARALLKNPPLLIFDEATSALDTENEMLVQEAIQNLLEHRTAVVIAHRLSTIQQADRIIVMDKGRIVESGTHSELLANDNGLYRRLYNIQLRGGSEAVVTLD